MKNIYHYKAMLNGKVVRRITVLGNSIEQALTFCKAQVEEQLTAEQYSHAGHLIEHFGEETEGVLQ